jgi:uncharacterized lipoprotein YehR (DUF1307 family)
MKKLISLTLIFIIVFVITGCGKKDASKYTGTYIGTLTATDFVKEDVELTFTNKSSKKEVLYLYGIALTRTASGQYNANNEIALKIINILNEDMDTDIISNTSVLFVFEEDEVTMDMQYNIAGVADPFYIRYIGVK